MNRRNLLKMLAAGGIFGSGFKIPLTSAATHSTERLVVLLSAEGGWDPTSFCDPKTNVPGERPINNWANTADVQQAGNLSYAPVASNQTFFDKYADRSLVINGIDTQTNSHDAGVVHTWSGRLSEGYPSINSLISASHGPELPMSYLSFGGYSNTAGISRFTRVNNPALLLNIAYPNSPDYDRGRNLIHANDWARIEQFRAQRMSALMGATDQLPRARRNRELYQSAMTNGDGLRDFADLLPPEDQLESGGPLGLNIYSDLRRQMQVTTLAFKAGVSICANLYFGGFDTHDNHDALQDILLGHLTTSIDYLWEQAEQQGIADRLLVIVGSDFARTPHYNSDNGKDHWPIGSMLFMEKNAPWGNNTIGLTDEGHNALKVNPVTLQPDATDGIQLLPAHIHLALRDYLQVQTQASSFPFNNMPLLPIFRTPT